MDRAKINSKYRAMSFQTPRLKITFTMKPILLKLVDKGLLRYKGGDFFPTSYKAVLKYDIANIIRYLRSVFRGLSNHYGIAHNWYDAKILYNYFGRYCAAMTIAHKTKSKVPKVFDKYGTTLCVAEEKNKKTAMFGFLSNSQFKRNIQEHMSSNLCVTDVEQLLIVNLRIARKQIVRQPCITCSEPDTIMSHIKPMGKVLQKKKIE